MERKSKPNWPMNGTLVNTLWHQNLGEYAEATEKIRAALKEPKRVIG